MENQHRYIKGYRELSQREIDLMNMVKNSANDLAELINEIKNIEDIDKRWLEIGTTDLQKGSMGVIRAITKPTSF